MRSNWTGYFDKLEPIPKLPTEDNSPNAVSSKLIPQHVRDIVHQTVHLGSFVFILALACDGFNPWRGVQYTMWFLAVRILNLKTEFQASTVDLITIGIISGPREPKTLQYYANTVVVELLFLQANHVTIPRKLADGTSAFVYIIAYLVAIIGDYPALCKILHRQGVGSRLACICCWVEGQKLFGIRQFAYEVTDTNGMEFPLVTLQQMIEYGTAATFSGLTTFAMKGMCPLLKVLKSAPGTAAIDLAHALYNYFKIIMKLLKNVISISPYKKPTASKANRALYPDGIYPDNIQAALDAKIKQWEKLTAAQEAKTSRNKLFKQTDKVQGWMDTLYRWGAGPVEFGHPSRRPLLWTGTMNIHNCQNWWVSKICLYMTYPFVDEDLYSVIRGLHEILKRLFRKPINQAELREYRPKMMETLKLFYKILPENWHGILVHGLTHVYDLLTKTGVPAVLLTMYIFERLVAWFNRQIFTRLDPEMNLAKNMDRRTGLLNSMYSPGGSISPEEWSQVPEGLLKGLSIDISLINPNEHHNDTDSSNNNAKTKVPVRSRNTIQIPIETMSRSEIGSEVLDTLANHGHTCLTELRTSVFIEGLRRNTTTLEPLIGSQTFCRRSSGFVKHNANGVGYEYGQLLNVYQIPQVHNHCLLRAVMYSVEEHVESGLERVLIHTNRIEYILSSTVHNSVVFAPWFDRGTQNLTPGSVLTPDDTHYCVIPTDYPNRT
jgi:hypothetical protein